MRKPLLIITLLLLSFGGSFSYGAITPSYPSPADSAKAKSDKPEEYFLALTKKLKLTGFTQVRFQYIDNAASVNSFDVRRARLDLRGNITEKASYRLQLDAAGTPKILDANAAYQFNQFLKVGVGQFKVPLGYESFFLNPNTLISINNSQATDALTGNSRDIAGNNNGRDIGVLLSGGYAGSKKFNYIEYYAGAFNGSGINILDNNTEKDYAGRLIIQPIKGLTFGGSYYTGIASYALTTKDPVLYHQRDRWQAELVYTRERITFNAEFIQGVDGNQAKGVNITRQGYYGQLAAFVLPKKVQLLVKYDNYDPNTSVGTDALTLYTFGANYYFTPLTRIMLNYEWKTEEGTKVNNDTFLAEFQIGF